MNNNSEAERLYQESLQLFRSGQLHEAVSRLEESISLNPKSADALEVLGVLYEKTDRLDQAIETMKQLAHMSPNHVMAHVNLSRFYVQKGMILEAEQEQGEARRLSWKEELRAQKTGEKTKVENPGEEAKAREQEIESRIERYRKVIALDPADVLGYFSLGSALLEAKRLDGARAAFEQAVSVNSEHSPSYFNLGLVLESLGRKEEAVKIYETGIPVAEKRGDMIPLKKMQARLAMLKGTT